MTTPDDAFPEELGPFIIVIRELVATIEKFDFSEPITFALNLQKQLEQSLTTQLGSRSPQSSEALRVRLHHLFTDEKASLLLKDSISETKARLREDPKYKELLHLFDDVHDRFPLLAVQILFDKVRRPDLVKIFTPTDALRDAETTVGERRATALKRVLPDIVSSYYEPYLSTLWKLSYFREGEWYGREPNLGPRVAQLIEKLRAYPNLIDPDVALFRNAAVHGRWEYHPESDSITVSDINVPPRSIATNELYDRCMAMIRMSTTTLMLAQQLHWHRVFLGRYGLFKGDCNRLEALFSDKEDSRKSAVEEIIKLLAPLTSRTEEFIKAKKPPEIAP